MKSKYLSNDEGSREIDMNRLFKNKKVKYSIGLAEKDYVSGDDIIDFEYDPLIEYGILYIVGKLLKSLIQHKRNQNKRRYIMKFITFNNNLISKYFILQNKKLISTHLIKMILMRMKVKKKK